MKLVLSTAFLALQYCQGVQATDDHANDLTKQFKTMKSMMKKHPNNLKSIHALQKKKKNFNSLHRHLEDFEVSECEENLYNMYVVDDGGLSEEIANGLTLLPDLTMTWNGDQSDLDELTDKCTSLEGSISFLDMNVEGEQCADDDFPIVYFPFCIPDSCTTEEVLAWLSADAPDDDYFNGDDNVGRRLEDYEGNDDELTMIDDFYEDCSYEYFLSEGPPEIIIDPCFGKIYNMKNNFYLFLTRLLYGFFTENDNVGNNDDFYGFGGDADEILTNFTETCQELDASVYFTMGVTNGQCFTEDMYGYQIELDGWDVLPECIPNECTQVEALDAYQTLYNLDFPPQPCSLALQYTFPPDDDETPEDPPSPPSPNGPSSKSPKSSKSSKSPKSSKALKMPKMPKMPKMVKMAKAAEEEYKGLRSKMFGK